MPSSARERRQPEIPERRRLYIVVVLLQGLIVAAWLLLLGRVVMSWVDPRRARPISQFVYRATEPLLAPIRDILPRTGQIDLSPLILLIGLGFLLRFVLAL